MTMKERRERYIQQEKEKGFLRKIKDKKITKKKKSANTVGTKDAPGQIFKSSLQECHEKDIKAKRRNKMRDNIRKEMFKSHKVSKLINKIVQKKF